MLFWIICVVLALVVAGLVVAPLVRGVQAAGVDPDVAFYRAQLDELDRDIARGTIDAAEGERARVEVQRRLLAADARGGQELKGGVSRGLAIAVVVLLGAIGLAGYLSLGAPGYPDLPIKARIAASDEMRANRPDQATMQAAALPPLAPDVPDDYLASVQQLRTLVPTRPDDLRGWELLAYHEAQMREYPAAVAAQAHVIALKGDDATNEDLRLIVDFMVTAADGLVSPEAEVYIRQILDADETDIAGRYYLGALYYQTDRSDVALRMWKPIVADGDPEAFYVAAARRQIEDAAFRAGVKYSLPDVRGPNAADIANAQDMTAADRQEMIRGMVGQLAARLADEGGPASEWARLIGAYGVLGEVDKATEVWLEAQEVFAGSNADIASLRAAADAAGVAK